VDAGIRQRQLPDLFRVCVQQLAGARVSPEGGQRGEKITAEPNRVTAPASVQRDHYAVFCNLPCHRPE
jgi:hypothetical protein